MGDDEVRALKERARAGDVDALAAKVLVGETGQVRHLLGERSSGIVAVRLALVLEDFGDDALQGV